VAGTWYVTQIIPDAMDAILIRPVREQSGGAWHYAGERVEVCGSIRRANFDTRLLTRVRFSDGSMGLAFEEELGQMLDTPSVRKLEGLTDRPDEHQIDRDCQQVGRRES
jgi:hypothetical protein